MAFRKRGSLDAANCLNDLRIPPGNRREALRGDRHGPHSICIHDPFRICFRWADGGVLVRPGGVLLEEFLKPMGISQYRLALASIQALQQG